VKLSTTPQELRSVLQIAARACPSNHAFPIISGILFEAFEGGKLTMTGTDLEQGISASMNVEVLEPGETVIPKNILGILGKLPNKPIILETKEAVLNIHYGDNCIKLNCMPPEEFPRIQAAQGAEYVLDFDPKNLAYAADSDLSSGVFCTIHLDLKEGNAVATNKHRLVVVKTQAMETEKFYNVPAKFLSGLPLGAKIQLGENLISAVHGDVMYTARLFSGQYPRYQQVIPKGFLTKVGLGDLELLGCVERVMLLSEKYIRIEFSGLGMNVFAQDERGEINEFIPAQIEGDPVTMGFNPAYLADALRHCGKNAVMSLGGPLSAVVINNEEGSRTELILPVRVKE
jgi:DNA polymerase-3 subunit beta